MSTETAKPIILSSADRIAARKRCFDVLDNFMSSKEYGESIPKWMGVAFPSVVKH